MFSFCIFGSVVGYAQEQQASGQQDQNQQAQDQDVAKAAREERARKQSQQKTPKHVYTADDLKRDQILTPEDRAMFEASRRQWTPLVTAPSQNALDAQSLPPDAPLGDIARSLQRQKELMRLRRSNEFHLSLPDAPVLASPKPSMEPLRTPLVIIEPARPRVVGTFHPPVRRSPFERPRILAPEFATPHAVSPALPKSHATPAAPEAPRTFAVTPSAPRVSPKKPRAAVPAPEMQRQVGPAPVTPQASPAAPKAPRNLVPAKPTQPAVALHSVMPAPEMLHSVVPAPVTPQASPAAPKAPRNLAPAKPARPAVTLHSVMPAPEMPHSVAPAPVAPLASPAAPHVPHSVVPATPARPTFKAPRPAPPAPPVYHVVPGTPAIPFVPPVAPANAGIVVAGKVVTVLPGDSLWKIAEQHLGSGLRWQELLAVNPGISNPSRILAGSQIVLPSASRAAKYTVQKGDSLWTIAQLHLGRATAWSCVAKANPQIADANLILEGQVLSLPASCDR
ncbi:MAG TPA: LysM peptidoglycan-binding domain-containing protein [Candidatus Angelobacter sp.]|nr:LysM peptidoglycan-binding domain-containing protein [Candidatus Angelobacter sp.]